MKTKKVGILGFGTVGSGVYKILNENKSDIMHREHIAFEIKRILVRDFETEPNINMAPKEVFTTNINDILDDEEISIIVECMGGEDYPRFCITQSLLKGKTVVTSNKEVLAKHWSEFETAAKSTGAGLYHEGTVGGGIPILRTITDSMQANNITDIMGIINGTTNYILSRMTSEGLQFDAALAEAQRLGFAEADPTADVDAWDATYKLSILASMAFHAHIPIEYIYREGIAKITAQDIKIANELGYEIKLLAIGKKRGTAIEVRVHPTMIPKQHPLAAVRGSFNAIFLKGHAVDDIMLYGRGAGQMPTASAVVSDIIYAAHVEQHEHRYPTFKNSPDISEEVELIKDWECIYCIRLKVMDKPGVLASISRVFADNNVSLNTVIQLGDADGVAPITFVTHKAYEQSLQKAMADIAKLDVVYSVENVIRVEN